MSTSVAIDGEGRPPRKTQRNKLRLFSISAAQWAPRVVSSLVAALVAGFYIGPVWTLTWLGFTWANLCIGMRLTALVAERRGTGRGRRLLRIAIAHGVGETLIHLALMIALWRTGEPVAQTFAFTMTLMGATYLLLAYYADLTLFRLLLTPYAAAMLYMSFDIAIARGVRLAEGVTLAVIVFNLAYFFIKARAALDRSRTALLEARALARERELAAESANLAKSAFLATMSHEIRTPLNGVLGMAQAMAADELNDVQRGRLDIIHRSGEALLAILNDVLDLSKIEAGKLELEATVFDLGEVAQGAYSAFTALANAKGVAFTLDVAAARGRYLGDPMRLRQILYNLVSNALKFTEAGEVRVSARRDGETLEIKVIDTGLGISPANRARLFQKFDQLDSSTTRRFGGTGLGLAICRELAHLMGGDIIVDSELGQGSCFTIRAKLPYLGEETEAVALDRNSAAELAPSRLRVLAAEDNHVNQLVLRTLFEQMGLDLTLVDDGESAIEAWALGGWDLILMDIQMPGMDGLTATAAIRAKEQASGLRRTPIIALTANAMSHQVEEYIAAGMDGHVAKPIAAADLLSALRRVADGCEVERSNDDHRRANVA